MEQYDQSKPDPPIMYQIVYVNFSKYFRSLHVSKAYQKLEQNTIKNVVAKTYLYVSSTNFATWSFPIAFFFHILEAGEKSNKLLKFKGERREEHKKTNSTY